MFARNRLLMGPPRWHDQVAYFLFESSGGLAGRMKRRGGASSKREILPAVVAMPSSMVSPASFIVAAVGAVNVCAGRSAEPLGLSLGLLAVLAGQDGQPSGVVGVLRPLGDAAVEFAAPDEGSA